MSSFKLSKSLIKGVKGSLLTAGAMVSGLLLTGGNGVGVEVVAPVPGNAMADSLAQAISSGDSLKIKSILSAAIIGFIIEVLRNVIKNRARMRI